MDGGEEWLLDKSVDSNQLAYVGIRTMNTLDYHYLQPVT